MAEETWAGVEAMHATLGGGAVVDAKWARREAARPPGDGAAEEVEEEDADLDDDAQASTTEARETPASNVIPATGNEPVALRGSVPEIAVTLLEVQDPGEADEDGIVPDEGMRYIGIRLRVANTGDESYYETPSMEATVVGSDGAEYEAYIGWFKPDLDDLGTLEPGESAEGFLTFEVPERMKPKAFRYAYSVKTPPDAAEWKL